MRVGKGIHPEGMPGWCQGFSLDGGSGVRALKVIQHGNRPGLIYNIGRCWWELENPVELLVRNNVSDTRNRTIAAEKHIFLKAFEGPEKAIKRKIGFWVFLYLCFELY